ncbi:hypothetical protein CBR_g26002 [Chara braunii]|uniref:Reverse transcriptase domain-containing protein n=1 Tax=Chara braunii TaxID=69332 RepID=A0A388L6Y7_CHABU|nr:hypothetical protein CBR_g26002 [Chara braunii]|eukprot:GBG78065.1 hypothetical protein CBR_g26002 [Chara braunii]
MREAEAREARLEPRMVRLLRQHTRPSCKTDDAIGKKKSPKTKARMLREIRSYLVESNDDSEEVKEEAGKLIEAIKKRKGKKRGDEEGVISKNVKKGYYRNPVKIEEDEEEEVKTPPPVRKGAEGGNGGTEMLDLAIELHRRLSEKKVPKLRKLCSQEGIEWSKKDSAIVPGRMLERCIKEGVGAWFKGRQVRIEMRELQDCYQVGRCDHSKAMTVEEVEDVMKPFKQLVAVPIDRNPGSTLLLCPQLYVEACRATFNRNPSFTLVQRGEEQLLRGMRGEFDRRGLGRIARWQTGGKFGQAYGLPKDKDLDRWRPISPATDDPARLAGAREGRAIRYMLFGLDRRLHFDLKATDELKERMEKIERELGSVAEGALAASYDIKDMFARLTHDSVMEAVEWITHLCAAKGFKGVSICLRGKICTMMRLNRKREGCVSLSFAEIKSIIQFELLNTYVKCAGSLLKQEFGIPIGRNSSPTLACLVCAKAEAGFMNSLGANRALLRGVRMIDDVAIVVAYRVGDVESNQEARRIREAFDKCYDQNLKLVRKDEGSNIFDFVGTRIFVQVDPIRVLIHPVTRNQTFLRQDRGLKVQSMQDYASFLKKSTKKAAVFAALISECRTRMRL